VLIHREALELAKNAAAVGDGVPFTISCVNISEDGSVTITDGHHWLRMNAAADEPNLFDEIAEDGTEALDGPVMIPAEVVQAFNAAMKKKKTKKGMPVPHVIVAQQEDRVTLRSSDGKTTRTFLMEAVDANLKYPDVDRTVLAHAPTHHITLSVDLLSKIVRALKACKAPTLKLGLPTDPEAPIHLTAYTETGSINGAMMPMREHDPKPEAPKQTVVDDDPFTAISSTCCRRSPTRSIDAAASPIRRTGSASWARVGHVQAGERAIRTAGGNEERKDMASSPNIRTAVMRSPAPRRVRSNTTIRAGLRGISRLDRTMGARSVPRAEAWRVHRRLRRAARASPDDVRPRRCRVRRARLLCVAVRLAGFRRIEPRRRKGTALKPAHEPIALAWKPFKGSISGN
jgi:hypothetical protein